MKTVVNLLGRMLVFPEWEDHVEMLQNLYDEAKCQVRSIHACVITPPCISTTVGGSLVPRPFLFLRVLGTRKTQV